MTNGSDHVLISAQWCHLSVSGDSAVTQWGNKYKPCVEMSAWYLNVYGCMNTVAPAWLKDKDFGKQTLHKGHANPLAEVTTSLKTYQHFTLEKAYLGEDFFWAFTPVAGDFIRIRFFTPVRIERLVRKTYWVRDTVLEGGTGCGEYQMIPDMFSVGTKSIRV